MKIKTTPMRTVTYFGADIKIPAHHIAVAADANGCVYSYDATPIKITTAWLWSESYLNSYYAVPARVDFAETIEWRNSLQLYPLAEANKMTAANLKDLPVKPHPHFDLMMKYVEIAQTTDKPWEAFQVKGFVDEWVDVSAAILFNENLQYRLKPEPPKTIRIGEYDVPEPVREPLEYTESEDERYWFPKLNSPELCDWHYWYDDEMDKQHLLRGIIHLTKEAAIQHAKALLQFTKAAE